jgi:hypothetical protein
MDKNNDDFVTLDELNAFSWAVYKKKWLTQEELRTQHWMLKNQYPKDMLGSDNKFDSEEYVYLIKAGSTTLLTQISATLIPRLESQVIMLC